MTKATEYLGKNGFVPFSWSLGQYVLRDRFITQFGFAILDDQTARELCRFSPILEVNAGSGYWTYELFEYGVDIVAADPGTSTYFLPWNGGQVTGGRWTKLWCNVEKLTATEAVKKYPERTLLTVWPDLDHKDADKADWEVEMLSCYQGKTVLYVGEHDGGATGTKGFHEYLQQHFELADSKPIPQFMGIHDSLQIWTRKPLERDLFAKRKI